MVLNELFLKYTNLFTNLGIFIEVKFYVYATHYFTVNVKTTKQGLQNDQERLELKRRVIGA